MGCGTSAECARDACVQYRQNQVLEALLNQAPGFEPNLFTKEPLKRHYYYVYGSVSKFRIEFMTVLQN